MAIDHPDWLFGVLCSIQGSISRKDFDNALIQISGSRIKERSKLLEMHLYMLTTLKLLDREKMRGDPKYVKTPLAEDLCNARTDEQRSSEYQGQLRSILLRNHVTGPFFRKFIQIIGERAKRHDPIRLSELKEFFTGETTRALYSLGLESGLIRDYNGLLMPGSMAQREIDPKLFKSEIETAYKAIQERQKTGIELRTIYVEISKIRDIILAAHGLTDSEKFDGAFKRLLESPEGRSIHIYGAAPQWLPERIDQRFEELIFRHKGKIYVFMSIS